MQNIKWEEQYPHLKQKLAVLEDTPLPSSLSSQALFEKLDAAEKPPCTKDELAPLRRIPRWRPVLSYAAAFVLLVAVYYGAGFIGVANTSGGNVSMSADMSAPRSAYGVGASPSAAAAAEAADEGAVEEDNEETAQDKSNSREQVLFMAPPDPTEEYQNALRNTVLVVPALVGESSQSLISTAQEAMENASMVVVGTLEEIGLSHYGKTSHLPYGSAVLAQLTVLKGENPGEILSFDFAGGFVPATEYYEEAARNSANKEGIKEGLEGKFVQVLLPIPQPEFAPGERYLLMLHQEDGIWKAATNPYGVLEILDDGTILGPEGQNYGTVEDPRIRD